MVLQLRTGRRTRFEIVNFRADLGQISKVKEKVEEKAGIPPVQQRLIYGGKAM